MVGFPVEDVLASCYCYLANADGDAYHIASPSPTGTVEFDKKAMILERSPFKGFVGSES